MLNQTWLISSQIRLLTVQHVPPERVPAGGAVLFAGFSHPMCDVDYFMSRLGRRLVNNGVFVVQVDPRGHGDSYGELADVDLDTLREDINVVTDHFAGMFPKRLLLVGRGLAATLIAEQLGGRPQFSIAGICPYDLTPDAFGSCVHAGNAKEPSVDAFALFPGNDYYRLSDFDPRSVTALKALGAMPYSVHGSRLSRSLIRQLAVFDASSVLRNGRNSGTLLLEDPFMRAPEFQLKLLSELTRWAASHYTR
jgi:hypothetical protein